MTEIQEKVLLTGDDVLRMPESMTEGYELIEGELVKMAPTGIEHGTTEFGIAFELGLWNRQHKLGRVMTGEVGFYIYGHDRTSRAADVAFMSYTRLPADQPTTGYGRIAPELVVEVISPGNTAEEMEEKIREWFAFGVLLVWVAYPSSRRVHVFTAPDQLKIFEADQVIDGGNVLSGFSAKVSDFF